MNKDIKPLYRKVNTLARGCHHQFGSDAKYDRHTKKGVSKSMKKNVERGLDYTPLYKFLLSKVGEDWDLVHSQAVKRLDKEEPIYHLVARNDTEKKDHVRCGENSLYSGLFIDSDNRLQKVKPDLRNENLTPSCACCTHTFNGVPLVKKFEDHLRLLNNY
ncbi:MAG TPA: hypothetical protein VNX68_01825 [Nitrosopumilaceae archaeon]|jgi:hypothetical protein|nr:hypothetical protein [Nitrosopumilaceae archaeon]